MPGTWSDTLNPKAVGEMSRNNEAYALTERGLMVQKNNNTWRKKRRKLLLDLSNRSSECEVGRHHVVREQPLV